MLLRLANLAILLSALLFNPAMAWQTDPNKLSKKQESIAQDLFHEVRCVTCESETIASSNAEIAIATRQFIRQQIKSGHNKDDIKQQLTKLYGRKILQTPPMQIDTILLWIAPFAFILFGVFIITRRKKLSIPD